MNQGSEWRSRRSASSPLPALVAPVPSADAGATAWPDEPQVLPEVAHPRLGGLAWIAAAGDPATPRSPIKGVQWTPLFVAFLAYVFAMTTYRLPIGSPAMAIAAVAMLFQRDKARFPTPFLILLVFLGWAAIGLMATQYPDAVSDRLQVVAKVWFIGLVSTNAIRSRAQLRFFLLFWLGCFALYPVRGAIFNYYIYRETEAGRAVWQFIYDNPNDLAAYCLLQLSFAIGLVFTEPKGFMRKCAMLGMAVVPFVILLTKSRGAFMAFAAFILFVLLGHKKRARAFLYAGVIGAVVLLAAPAGVLDRMGGLAVVAQGGRLADADPEQSARQRYEIWRVARGLIVGSPVIGVGLGAYPEAHEKLAQNDQYARIARGPRDSHSLYLNVTAETGFVGMAIYLFAYIGALVRAEKIRRRIKRAMPREAQQLYLMELGVLAFFLAGIFGSLAHVSFLVISLGVMWVTGDLSRREHAARLAHGAVEPMAPPPSWPSATLAPAGSPGIARAG